MASYLKLSNRKPPKPLSWNCPRGNCRFCGGPIFNKDGTPNKRKHWHVDTCLIFWKLANDPKVARAFVWEHYKGICQGCGKSSWSYGEKWQVDHKDPLFLAAGDFSYWEAENLQLMCDPCHREKTKKDMQLFREVADKRNFNTISEKKSDGKN